MDSILAPVALLGDRRVRKTRAALMKAAVELVSERGTGAVSITDLADTADVSRAVVYQQFGDRDSLLLEAALDMFRRELVPQLAESSEALRGRAQALACHLADHGPFYRAMLTSSSAFQLNKGLIALLFPINRALVEQMYADGLDRQTVEDLAQYLSGGAVSFVNSWVVEGEDPLDPAQFTDRIMRLHSIMMPGLGSPHPDNSRKKE